jgi:hypothetical protein
MRFRLILAALAVPVPAAAQQGAIHPTPAPSVAAVRLDAPVTVDGKLEEPVWQTPAPATGFRQSQPRQGEPARERTEVRFAYDDEALYVGARMYDSLGGAGVRTRLVRRDAQADADYLEVIFDTYHDHLGRTVFQINPSGVRTDGYGPGGTNVDLSWDPVWEAKAHIDSLGWTAEMRIPFSQLRYSRADQQTWGLQIWRQSNRDNELSSWAFWRLNETGGPPRFGHLTGLRIGASPSRAEILPYVVGRSTNLPPGDPADPFNDPHAVDGRAGVDAKVLVNSSLTLNATINPDFGQVEVDPAVVNLSAFETFFDERRPFFVEGSGLFAFGGLNCHFCSNVSGLTMFYSRRIGRAPQATGNAFAAGPYADVPENTAILGAAKLTGRTPTGWSLGFLDAVTGAGHATVAQLDGTRSRVTVEPLTNYFVGRVAKDLRGGSTVIRGMATSVVRQLGDPALGDLLTSHSESGGFSTDWFFGQRTYRLMAQVAGSRVSGSPAAIDRIQRSSARYFQRPDRSYGSYDPSRTSLAGYAAYTRFSKDAGDWLWEAQTNIRSPGFENNDIGFLTRAGYLWFNGNLLRQFTNPGRFYRSLTFLAGGQQQFNYDGDVTDRQVQGYASIQALNYWEASGFFIHRWNTLEDGLTRGGPVVQRPGYNLASLSVESDSRKSIVLDLEGNYGVGLDRDHRHFWEASADIRWRPLSNLTLSLGPLYSYDETSAQYVQAVDDATAAAFYGKRYVFAGVTQRTLSMNTRVNMTFTPNLTLELFAQPFIASGSYDDFKEFAAPRELTKLTYGRDVGTITSSDASGTRQFTIDPDGAGAAAPFTVADPSFTVRSLRGNAVLRWEYRPGSTLFLVWTQSREDQLNAGTLDFGRDARAVFSGPAENIFLVKVNYWIGF